MSRNISLFRGVLAALFAGLTTGTAFADIDTIRGEDNTLWLAAGGTHIRYAERDTNGVKLDTEHGLLAGISGGFSFLDENSNLYLAIDADGAWGKLGYNGQLQDGTPFNSNNAATIWSTHYRVGWGSQIGTNGMLVPYAEVGYRHWDRDLGNYSEAYKNWDMKVGLMGQYSPLPRTVFSLWGAVGQTFAASMDARGVLNAGFDLGNELTYNFGLKAGFMVTSRIELFTRATIDELSYKKSKQVPVYALGYYFDEPDSHTETITTQLGIAYRFQ